MIDLSTKKVSDLIYDKLESLEYEVVLTNPTAESIFPCIELHTPLKSVNKTQNAFPISSDFQVSVTCHNETQRKCMEMSCLVDEKMQEYNFTRTNTSPSIFNVITKKYGITVTYEVRYNALTNSFEFKK